VLKADLHCHTIHSPDSCNRLAWIIERCRKTGINCLAVTDHNDVDGAIELMKTAPFHVIIGEEVDTGEGEIIGLFLKRWIAPRQGLEKTIEEIRSQEGLVYLPHPLSICRGNPLDVGKIKGLMQEIDIVEVFNSRTRRESRNSAWLAEWVLRGGVVQSAGSDAHAPHELGNVLIEMDDFNSKEGFLSSLAMARFSVRETSTFLRAVMNRRVRKIIRRCC
jgi:hypothetical protein